MFIKYLVMKNQADQFYAGNDSAVFEGVPDSAVSYSMQILFGNSNRNEKGPFLRVVGHDKPSLHWRVSNRIWRSTAGVHFCIGGKGYFNGMPVQRGDCFVVLPNVSHSIETDSENPMEFYWIQLKGEGLNRLMDDYDLRGENTVLKFSNVEKIRSLFEICMASDYNRLDTPKYTMSFAGMVLSSISRESNSSAAESTPHEDSLLKNYIGVAKHMMRESDYRCSVQDIANALGIDPKYFCRIFRSEGGESPKQYMTRKRMGKAVELLETGISPMNVASLMGYSDYVDFYRAFKKRYSVSPSQFITKSNPEANNSN